MLIAAGATAGHSRQRAWMLGPLRIERTSAMTDASCCCGFSAALRTHLMEQLYRRCFPEAKERSSSSRKLVCGSR